MTDNVGIKATKPMTTIYVALLLSIIGLLLMNNLFGADVADYRVRIVTLVFYACVIMMIVGAEIARFLYKAGITPVGFIAFLFTNLLFIMYLFASFVDHMGNDLSETTGAMIGTLLIGGIIWYAIIIIWTLMAWIREMRKPQDSQS